MDQALDKSFGGPTSYHSPTVVDNWYSNSTPGSDREYAIEFPVEGELKGVRIDPLQGPGKFRIDWISLEYAAGENGTWSGTDVDIQTIPSTEVNFAVTDADGSPCMAAFEIRDEQGRVYPYQSKRQAPDFFFQTQIYRETARAFDCLEVNTA